MLAGKQGERGSKALVNFVPISGVFVALVDRAQRILTTPNTEWPVIAAEPATVGGLYSGYIIPLAAIPAIALFIGRFLLPFHTITLSVTVAVLTFVLSLVSVFIVALIAAALAPSFGGVNDQIAGLKWAAYSQTAAWIAGIANIIPIFGGLIALVGLLYSLYLFYLGTIPMMRVPPDKALGYAVVVILVNFVISLVIGGVVGVVITMMAVGNGALNGGLH